MYGEKIYQCAVPNVFESCKRCSRRASGSSVRSQASQRSAASNRSGSVSRGGSRQQARAKTAHNGSAAAASGTEGEEEDERVPPAPPPATVGGGQQRQPHEPVRRAASSPLDAADAGAPPEQPITRPLRSHLSQDLRDKEATGYDTAATLD
ncbi:hypothetical protein V5799_007485 [Amblyomma americanum]|uniref:Uncharacterized protein n=1 Tax=Amblyomma americanum TaxID=6943 RepID=A0AAQ4FHH2_AMBAM